MPRAKTLLLGLLLLAGLLDCKTKAPTASTGSSPAMSSAASSSTCSTKLALVEVQAKPRVDSSKLTTTNFKVANFNPVEGSKLALVRVTATLAQDAEFVFYRACSSSDQCYDGILASPAPAEANPKNDPYLLMSYDGRLPAGNYTFQARSCIWKDNEANSSIKEDLNYAGRPNRPFHCGKKVTASLNFTGTDQPYRDLFVQEFKKSDEVQQITSDFQDGLASYKDSLSSEELKGTVVNAVNLRGVLGQLVESPDFADLQSSVRQAGSGLGLASSTTADPCASVAVDSTGDYTVEQAATTPAVTPDQSGTSQADQAAAMSAAIPPPAAPPSTVTSEPATDTSTTSAAGTTTDTAALDAALTFDVQQMQCESAESISKGYVWDDSDPTNPVCRNPPPSTVNPAFASSEDPNPYLYYGGIALLSLGAAITAASLGSVAIKRTATSYYKPTEEDLKKGTMKTSEKNENKYKYTFREAWRATLKGLPRDTEIQGKTKTINPFVKWFTKPTLLLITSPLYALVSLGRGARQVLGYEKKNTNKQPQAPQLGQGAPNPSTKKTKSTTKLGPVLGTIVGVALMTGGYYVNSMSLQDATQSVYELSAQSQKQIRIAQAERLEIQAKVVCALANEVGGRCR